MVEVSGPEPGSTDKPETARLFFALDLPPETVELIGRWQAGAPATGGLRAVRPEALHLTLAFLGERPEAEVPALAKLVAELGGEAIAGVLRPEPVPVPRRRPKLLALSVESPGAERLQAKLSGRLQALGPYRPDRRPFWPHLTVFRLKARSSGRKRGERVERLEPLPIGDGQAFGFVRLALYRSFLRPEGSSYSALAANELPQPRGRQKR